MDYNWAYRHREEKIHGHNILPLLQGKAGAKTPHKAYFYQSKAVRIGNWKLLAGARGAKGKGPQLYDLSSDIGEKHNVAADHPEIVKKLSGTLEAFKAEMKKEGRPAGKL